MLNRIKYLKYLFHLLLVFFIVVSNKSIVINMSYLFTRLTVYFFKVEKIVENRFNPN